jgi:hypothetical protein
MAASTEASSLPGAPANLTGNPGGFTAENVPKPFEGAEATYPLDDARYAEDLKFFQKSTGIEDPLALKKHIFKIRDEAYKTFPYPCIWGESSHPSFRGAASREAYKCVQGSISSRGRLSPTPSIRR